MNCVEMSDSIEEGAMWIGFFCFLVFETMAYNLATVSITLKKKRVFTEESKEREHLVNQLHTVCMGFVHGWIFILTHLYLESTGMPTEYSLMSASFAASVTPFVWVSLRILSDCLSWKKDSKYNGGIVSRLALWLREPC